MTNGDTMTSAHSVIESLGTFGGHTSTSRQNRYIRKQDAKKAQRHSVFDIPLNDECVT